MIPGLVGSPQLGEVWSQQPGRRLASPRRRVAAQVRYLWSEEARRFRPAGVDHVSGQEAYKAREGLRGQVLIRKG